ncbi:hypothetical protein [Vreelandella titanicae]
MDRVFAWDHHHSQIVYRIPGHQYEDGREDSALSRMAARGGIRFTRGGNG